MAGPTLTQRVEDLTKRLQEAAGELKTLSAVTDYQIKQLEARLGDRTKAEEQLHAKVTDLTAKNAALEQRCVALEKGAERTWQGWLALIGAGLALLVAFLKS